MTASFVAASTAVTAVNASVSPTLPAGTVSGDVVLIAAAIRNSGTGVPATPSGWTRVTLFGASDNVQLFRRAYDGVWTMPTVTFTGGAAGDDTIAQAATLRGVLNAAPLTSSIVLNGSAQNMTLPGAVTPARGNSLGIVVGWKQDDFTSTTALAGWTKIADTSSTAGNDAGMVWEYAVQTATPAVSPTGSITVTGGGSAISRTGVAYFEATSSLTVTEQDTWPARVQITANPLTIGDSVAVYRSTGGTRTLVRGGSFTATDPNLALVDAELPFGVPVSYVVSVNGTEYTSTPVTYTLTGGKVAITDAITGSAVEATIAAWPEQAFDRQASVFRVGGRNVVVSGDFGQYTSTIDIYVETTSASDNLDALLRNATEGVVQIRQPGGYDGVDGYFAVTGATRRRYSQDGSDERRMWSLNVEETERWSEALTATGFTLGDIADYFGPSGTLQDIADRFGPSGTLFDIATADWS